MSAVLRAEQECTETTMMMQDDSNFVELETLIQ